MPEGNAGGDRPAPSPDVTGGPASTRGPVVVQKFGGTSVGSAVGRRALRERVAQARGAGRDVVVVVSAMGRAGDPYATDTLLSLLGDLPTDARERDMLSACGEIVSAVLVAHELRADGIPSRALTGADAGILTDGVFGAATVLAVDATEIREALSAGVVPVVAGFQGAAADGCLTTLGRGGSDTSACAIAVALGAESVEIHTDVDGVMTADPRVCADARVLDAVRYEELFQMARHGSKVVHVAAAEAAMEGGVPTRIRNTFSPAQGTLVTFADRLSSERLARVATAVSHIDGVARLRVALPDAGDDSEHTAAQTRVYRAMADAGVSLDMFTPMGATLAFTVPESGLCLAADTLRRLGLEHETDRDLAKVTLVGAGMHGVPGVMARLAECLAGRGVGILQTADSHATISVLVRSERAADAIAALHEGFGLGE